jgi:hypothetical protein
MATYPGINDRLAHVRGDRSDKGFDRWVLPYLIDVWLDDYATTTPTSEVSEVETSGFHYLFDVGNSRLLAAWAVSAGRHDGKRDASRMAGSPKTGGDLYHRGHAIPHTLGGPTDINLVPQLGKINIGAFRPLEKMAVATPGSFYFTYWIYHGRRPVEGGASQIPSGVDQGLLIPGEFARITSHRN